MNYQNQATVNFQALIVFVIDISGSMKAEMPSGKKRHTVVEEALQQAISQLAQLSFSQGDILPRYRILMIGYSEEVWDFYDGIHTIDEIIDFGLTELPPQRKTDPTKAMHYVKAVLEEDISSWNEDQLRYCPVPMVIHLTDAEITEKFEDPTPVVKEIQSIEVPDGNVLVANIFISEYIKLDSANVYEWNGFQENDDTGDIFGNKLLRMSSKLPDSYKEVLNKQGGLNLKDGAMMFYPGVDYEFIRSGFVLSASSSFIINRDTTDERVIYPED